MPKNSYTLLTTSLQKGSDDRQSEHDVIMFLLFILQTRPTANSLTLSTRERNTARVTLSLLFSPENTVGQFLSQLFNIFLHLVISLT